jgi:predicted ChrR family anti-sigma factor
VDFAILEGAFDANETVFLLRGKAGSALPTHGHETAERVLVLDGRFGIDGTIYGPGDFIESDGVTVHSPFVPGAGDCLCLFALEDGLILPPADEGARAARRWVFPSGE